MQQQCTMDRRMKSRAMKVSRKKNRNQKVCSPLQSISVDDQPDLESVLEDTVQEVGLHGSMEV